jgi:hypothetical protein
MLVCDSTFTPQAGAELRRAAEVNGPAHLYAVQYPLPQRSYLG